MNALDVVIDALTRYGCNPRRSGSGWSARCPSHEDSNPSLSATSTAAGTVLLTCHAGCTTELIMERLELPMSALFEPKGKGAAAMEVAATYDYVTAEGELVFQVVRLMPKSFRQRRPDGAGGWVWSLGGVKRVPYRLPEVIEAVAAGKTVYVVEGERDADTLRSKGLTATCNPGGAGKWRSEFGRYLYGANVVVLADNDDVGREHARKIGSDPVLMMRAKSLVVLELPGLPDKGDVSDWVAAGGTREQLEAMVHEVFEPDRERDSAPGRSSRLTGAAASTITPTAPEWLCEGWLLRRAVNLIAGRQGSGKTTWAMYLLAALSTGRPLVGMTTPGEPVNTAVLSLEEPPDRLVARLWAAGADLERVHVFGDMEDVDEEGRTVRRRWSLPKDIAALGEEIVARRLAIVVVDGLGYAIAGDSHNYAVVGSALSALAGEADRTGAAILGLVHPPKGQSDPVTAAIGSTAWTAIPRICVVLGNDPNDDTRRVVRVAKSNYKMPATGLHFSIGNDATYECGYVIGVGESDVSAEDVTAGPVSEADKTERGEAREFIAEYLADGPASTEDLTKAGEKVGISKRTLVRARKDLGVQSSRRADPTTGRLIGWELSLPDHRATVPTSEPQPEGWHCGHSGHTQDKEAVSAPERQSAKAEGTGGTQDHLSDDREVIW